MNYEREIMEACARAALAEMRLDSLNAERKRDAEVSRLRDAAIYREGVLDGFALFAHWEDGVQYVGTSGKTLGEAAARVDEWLPAPQFDEVGNPIGRTLIDELSMIGRGNKP